MITTAYTICFNEIKNIQNWLDYTKDFTYRVVLDTGSSDGSYELLKTFENVIVEQKTFEPFDFSEARNYCLSLVPKDTEWCLSPDMDEFFSINVLEEIEAVVKAHPTVHNIAYDRLDIRSKRVRIGPPDEISSNKIHKFGCFKWVHPVYEHIAYTGEGDCYEFYNPNLFLIHDQDLTKPRNDLYYKIMKRRYEEDPNDRWNNRYLLEYYYKQNDVLNFVELGCEFLKYTPKDDSKAKHVASIFERLIVAEESLPYELKIKMFHCLAELSKIPTLG
jgi:hypothetical protein